MRCRTPQFLFLVLLAGLILIRESRIAPLTSVERGFTNWLTANTQRHLNGAPLVLVQINDEDVRTTPLPWSPIDFSLFLNAALPFKPPVLAVEPVLEWKTPDAQQITLLHNQLLRVPKILLGSQLGFPEDPSIVPALEDVPVLRHVTGDISALTEFTMVAHQPGEELRLAGTLGFENLLDEKPMQAIPGFSQPVRRVPLVFRYYGQVVPSFSLQAAMLWFGVTAEDITVVPGSYIALGKSARIPIDARGAMFVDFEIPMTRFSMGDLLLSTEEAQTHHKTIAPVSELKHSLTLLARTDQASRTLHFANGQNGSPGELFAAAIATILNCGFMKSVPLWGEGLIILGGMVLALFCGRHGKLVSAVAGLVVITVYIMCALNIFQGTTVVLPLSLPVGLTLFVVLFRVMD